MREPIKRIALNVAFCIFFTNGLCAQYMQSYVPEYINSNYIFELVSDCLGEENFREVVNDNPLKLVDLSYDMNGNLERMGSGRRIHGYEWSGFLDSEWEQMFDYFDNLPPMPLPNPSKNDRDRDVESVMNGIKRVKGISFDGSWRTLWKYRDEYYYKDNPDFDWLEDCHSSYDIKDSGENPDSIFGEIKWHEVRSLYSEAFNSGNLKPDNPGLKFLTPEDFKKDGYCWEKIPISKYTVNIQMPVGTTISIAPDSLSASCIFPDSTRVSIQYTKGEPYTKLWDGEKNPRKRLITEAIVTDKYVLTSGGFMENSENKEVTFWGRIRYRYGVTITIYSSPTADNLNNFIDDEKVVLQTATIVMRPKYKNIYLKD